MTDFSLAISRLTSRARRTLARTITSSSFYRPYSPLHRCFGVFYAIFAQCTSGWKWRNCVQFLNCGLMRPRKERGTSRYPLISISAKSWLLSFVVHLDSASSHRIRDFNDIPPFAFAAYSYSEAAITIVCVSSRTRDRSGFTRSGSVEKHTRKCDYIRICRQ